MALSAKKASTQSLVDFVNYAKANGYRISEMPPYDAVVPGVHAKGSWHNDKDGSYGQAADINIGATGSSSYEMTMLKRLIPVAKSYGLGIILNASGRGVGASAAHTNHMHVDVGSYSNLGNGPYRQAGGNRHVVRVQKTLHQYTSKRDNLHGTYTRQDLQVLRAASRKGGTKFPLGVKRAQRVVGRPQTGKWTSADGNAHTTTMRVLQDVWRIDGYYTGSIDGVWGNLMDRATTSFEKAN